MIVVLMEYHGLANGSPCVVPSLDKISPPPCMKSLKIMKVEVTMKGVPNELYAQNMEYRHQYDEIIKHFAEGQLKEAGVIQKYLQLHNVNIASYYTNKYALWLHFRTIDDNRLHGLGG